jgi:hypothetical protein
MVRIRKRVTRSSLLADGPFMNHTHDKTDLWIPILGSRDDIVASCCSMELMIS